MAEALLPPEVLRTVGELECALQKVEEQFTRVLPSCTQESFEQLSPVERASTFSTLSKALTVLFTVYLKTNGISPDEHPVSKELARIDIYQDKVNKAVSRSTGPQRPASSLDVKAANRFVEHAIPDLSKEQKKSLRELGKKGGPKRQHEKGAMSSTPKKRPSGLTVAEEAAAFLAEASKVVLVTRGEEAGSDED